MTARQEPCLSERSNSGVSEGCGDWSVQITRQPRITADKCYFQERLPGAKREAGIILTLEKKLIPVKKVAGQPQLSHLFKSFNSRAGISSLHLGHSIRSFFAFHKNLQQGDRDAASTRTRSCGDRLGR